VRAVNTTIQNRTKQAKLASTHVLPKHHVDSPDVSAFLVSIAEIEAPKEQILFSIGVALLGASTNPAVHSFLSDVSFEVLEIEGIPHGAFDLLGSCYQYLNSKAENLAKGSFYTGREIATDFVSDLTFRNGETILDPACGSGAFLFRSSAPPEQIVGVDCDPIAIMIAKFNYFIKYPDADKPKLFCDDFFAWYGANGDASFDYVIGNPPFGANLDLSLIPSQFVRSGESFSYFIEFSFELLRPGGIMRFLVPEALLNVKRHTDIRDFLLNYANVSRIKRYPGKFAGVMSDMYMIEISRGDDETVTFEADHLSVMPKALYRQLKDRVFVQWSDRDLDIVEHVRERGLHDLKSSTFGLGVVTGDNTTKLLSEPAPGAEPIYTGKEVERFNLLTPRKFLVFDRKALQQVAPDEIYRSTEKLVYKTISKSLKFARDSSGALTTNSANILIPSIPGYDARTVMALLNSPLYSFLYIKLFGGVNKIGKEHLMALPFPALDPGTQGTISALVEEIERGEPTDELDFFIFEQVFGLSRTTLGYISEQI